MADWNRFDICEAYWLLEVDYNLGGWLQERPSNQRRNEATHVQLARLGFRPSPSLGFDSLEENAREIYLENVLKLKLPLDDDMRAKLLEFFVHDWLRENHPHVFLGEHTLDPELHKAVWSGDAKRVATMIEEGADVALANDDGELALHWAAWKGDLEMVKRLVEAGSNVNAQSRQGMTPAHSAATWGDAHDSGNVIQYLVDAGANMRLKNADGMTVMEYAREKGFTDLAAIIESMVLAKSAGSAKTLARPVPDV